MKQAASSTTRAALIQAFEIFYPMRLPRGCGYTQIVMCTLPLRTVIIFASLLTACDLNIPPDSWVAKPPPSMDITVNGSPSKLELSTFEFNGQHSFFMAAENYSYSLFLFVNHTQSDSTPYNFVAPPNPAISPSEPFILFSSGQQAYHTFESSGSVIILNFDSTNIRGAFVSTLVCDSLPNDSLIISGNFDLTLTPHGPDYGED